MNPSAATSRPHATHQSAPPPAHQDWLNEPSLAELFEGMAHSELQVERTGITFENISPECVRIAVRVTNDDSLTSQPAAALLSAAPLGVFVPWRPLSVVRVPALGPFEERVLTAEVRRVPPTPLGRPDRVPPRRLLTALGSDEDEPRDALNPMAQWLAQWMRTLSGQPQPLTLGGVQGANLPADPLELLGRPNPHWAGNLNVFIGGRAVERHMAQALRVYPGRTNIAVFMVGSGKDAYSFRLEGTGTDWQAALYDMTGAPSLAVDLQRASPAEEDEWIPVQGMAAFALALLPPEHCKRGEVEVHVRQRSSGQRAVVEFSLDPDALGPGCYTV